MSQKILGLGQVAITVSDIARARAFYCGTLGLNHLFDSGPNLAFLSVGRVRIMLTRPENGQDAGKNSVLYFHVENVDRAHSDALKMGAVDGGAPHLIAKMSDHELWMGFLKDPDDHLVGLMEERRPGHQEIRPTQANSADTTLLLNLSSRETQVLGLIAKGLRNKEIANHLAIAEKTVKNHVSNILVTLKVRSRTQAAMLAVKAKLILL